MKVIPFTYQYDFSSGRDDPAVNAVKIAEASNNFVCSCFDKSNFDASFQCYGKGIK